MTHPHLNAVHRQTVLRKLEALNPAPATNQAPRPSARPADPIRALRAAGDSLSRRLKEAQTMLANLRTSKTPVAAARRVETITRQAAADLSAARRFAAPQPAPSTRSARREAARTASTLSPATAANFTDALLSQAAVHRSSPESGRQIATAELEKRGFVVSPEGTISKSTRR